MSGFPRPQDYDAKITLIRDRLLAMLPEHAEILQARTKADLPKSKPFRIFGNCTDTQARVAISECRQEWIRRRGRWRIAS